MRLRKGISASVTRTVRYSSTSSIVQALVPPRGDRNKRILAFRCQVRGFEGSKRSSKRKLVIGSPGNRSGQGTVSPATITLQVPALHNRAVSFNNHPYRSVTVNFQFLSFMDPVEGRRKKKKSPNKCQLINFSGFALMLWMGWN